MKKVLLLTSFIATGYAYPMEEGNKSLHTKDIDFKGYTVFQLAIKHNECNEYISFFARMENHLLIAHKIKENVTETYTGTYKTDIIIPGNSQQYTILDPEVLFKKLLSIYQPIYQPIVSAKKKSSNKGSSLSIEEIKLLNSED